jgi:Holliday junction resolvasome RuvABC DNA-binding subunit
MFEVARGKVIKVDKYYKCPTNKVQYEWRFTLHLKWYIVKKQNSNVSSFSAYIKSKDHKLFAFKSVEIFT